MQGVKVQNLTDDEIVSQISSAVEEDDDDEQPDCSPQTTVSISNGEAVKMFDKCLEWLRQREGASTYNLTCLKELRELAARKRLSDIKQKKLQIMYFSKKIAMYIHIVDSSLT